MDNYKGKLPKNFLVNERYSVMLFIKQGSNAETYRVKGTDGKLYFLKLFNYAKLHRTAFDSENNLLEIELLKTIKHPNIVSYKDSGELIYEGKKFNFMVLNFIAGETLAERITREQISSLYDLKQIMSDVLNGLNYLHSLPEPIIHNEITPQNIMLDLSSDIPQAKIIDFGFARSYHQSSKTYNKEGLNLNYVASECFNSFYSPQSDLFSVGAVIYHLLFGMPPWFKDISKFKADRTKAEDVIIEERKKPIAFPKVSEDIVDFDESILRVLKKALENDPETRFQSANEFTQVLNGEIEIEEVGIVKVKSDDNDKKKIKTQKVKGFGAIAGMKELKAQLQLDVIDALHKPEEYAKYGITIPNGMLLYGPPGCGKTFFAKHFAEEVGFNFMLATPSTLKSRFINATQENIAKMFEEAEKNAPTIIFIDEINELLPNRDSDAHEMAKSAVNEMLAQMDRTGEKGIFIIGATNYPDMIDPAMLRAGRLDKKFYLPPPDFEARKAMFEMYLINRPIDFGIDYDRLSTLTEHYVSSDIEFLVNEASRLALKEKSRISMQILESTIKETKPSVPLHELQKYETVKAKMNPTNLFGGGTEKKVHCEINGKETSIDKTRILTKISGIINLKMLTNPVVDNLDKVIYSDNKPPIKFFTKVHVPHELKAIIGELYAIVEDEDELEQSSHILSDEGLDLFMGQQLIKIIDNFKKYEIINFPSTVFFVSVNNTSDISIQNKICANWEISYPSIGAKYMIKKILGSKTESVTFGLSGFLWPGYDVAVSDCSANNPNGTGYLFETDRNFVPVNLCSNESAVDYCNKTNSLAYYIDFMNDGKMRVLSKYTESINKNLQNHYIFRSSNL